MKQYHKNPRYITEKKYADLRRWLRELGDLSGIVHDLNSDETVTGNQRSRVIDINDCEIVLTAEYDEPDKQGTAALGYVVWDGKHYSYRAVRWTPEQCEQANIVANKAGGDWDFDILANGFEFDDLMDWGFDEAELLGVGFDLGKESPKDDPGPQIDKAEELREKWGVETGQLWQMGEHRLICGDCTNRAVVERVMGGERAQAVITDPPFFVRSDEWDLFESEDEFIAFTMKWVEIVDTDVVVAFMADHNVPLLFAAAAYTKHSFRRSLVWRKPPGSQFAGASLDGFWFDFEMINVFGKPAFRPDKKTKMAVLEHRTVTGQEHGCEKPIGVLEDLVSGYSTEDGLIVDLFNGTGTTLIACERLGRKCRAVELEPKYVAVTLQRYFDATGDTPHLVT